MNEEAINLQIRKFLKVVGVTSQREIEHALYDIDKIGGLTPNQTVTMKMTLEVPELNIRHEIEETLGID